MTDPIYHSKSEQNRIEALLEERAPKKLRGFAAMTPERRTEISRLGGQAVPGHKRQFSARKGFAAECGRKGGIALAGNKRTFSLSREAASCAGKRGVEVRRANNKKQESEDG